MALSRHALPIIMVSFSLVLLGALLYGGFRYWPRTIPLAINPRFPLVTLRDGEPGIVLPTQVLVAQVGNYPTTAASFLHFDWIRSRDRARGRRFMLCSGVTPRSGKLRIYVQLQDNILVDFPFLGSLTANEIIPSFALENWTDAELSYCEQQSAQLDQIFVQPPDMLLTGLADKNLIGPMADFLAFKSATDPRVLSQTIVGPIVLNPTQARELAEDIIVIARFYALPLNYFLGLGAMENNYMSIRGDLDHAVWKKYPQHGDIVLKRRHGRVLVRNYSLGIWQLTRETLRYVQSLYLQDRFVRDYTLLPKRLQPAAFQDPDEIQPETITTFAGLFFRALLDRFDGNVLQAVGAYNGGPGKPNPAYAAMVQNAANYARRVIVHSALFDARYAAKDQRRPAGMAPPSWPSPAASQ